MKKLNNWYIPFAFGILITLGQAYLLLHDLLESKPYKIVDPLNVFRDTAYVGVPLSLIICGLLTYFMRIRITKYLLPVVPIIAFPILVWGIYQAIFTWSGLDFFAGEGDFSVRQNELEFANDVLSGLFLGCVAGLICSLVFTFVYRSRTTRVSDTPALIR